MGIHYFIEEEEDVAPGKEKPKQQKNWMEEAQKRLELLKLEIEKENNEDAEDEDDWDGLDSDDCSDDCSEDD